MRYIKKLRYFEGDIIDNCKEIIQYDKRFGPRFLRECKMLLEHINKGSQQLYNRAKEMVEKEFK